MKMGIISVILTIFVILTLFLTSPAQAATLGIVNVYSENNKIHFTAKIDLHNQDFLEEDSTFTITATNDDNQQNFSCVVDINGNPLSGCETFTIIKAEINLGENYGYAYGYGYNTFNPNLKNTAEIIFEVEWIVPEVTQTTHYKLEIEADELTSEQINIIYQTIQIEPEVQVVKNIQTTLTPKTAYDRDDLVCNIKVENINNYQQYNDLIVYYEITSGFTTSGEFNCQGECNQDIIIPNKFTTANSEVKCTAQITYKSLQYTSTDTANIIPNPREPRVIEEVRPLEYETLRFVGGDTTHPGGYLELALGLTNEGRERRDVTAFVSVLELDLGRERVGPHNLRNQESRVDRVILDIPQNTPPGEYTVRITMNDGENRVVRHRKFFVE